MAKTPTHEEHRARQRQTYTHCTEQDYTTVKKPTYGLTVKMTDARTYRVTDTEVDINGQTDTTTEPLTYGLTDTPPWYLTLLFAFQMVLSNVFLCVILASVLTYIICADATFTSTIFSTTCVMSGITTVLQCLVGVRLPVFQGPTLLGFLPYMDARNLPEWRCGQNMTALYLSENSTGISPDQNAWDEQWTKVQGGLAVGAAVEAFLGLSGLIGLMARVIRPVTITSTFILIGVYLWEMSVNLGKVHWGVSCGSLGLAMVFALYINWLSIPIPYWTRRHGWQWTTFPIFELFPILLVICVMWPVSHVITVLGGFSDDPADSDYMARTDIYGDNIRNSPPFRFPVPGQLGGMTFDLKLTIFYIPCLVMSAIESLADYHQYALACQSPTPPPHAMNRGVAIEGISGVVMAWLGAGHLTTSYSTIMGVITLTSVGSRAVMAVAGVMIAVVGMIGPLGAALVAIPSPVLFGPFVLTISVLVGSGFHNLVQVDVGKRRNLSILGVSVYIGCAVSFYVKYTPNAIHTESQLFNEVASGLLQLPFMVGLFISVFLDMTIRDDTKASTSQTQRVETTLYDPPLVGAWMRKHAVFRYIPFLPGPQGGNTKLREDVELSKQLQEVE